MTFVGTFKHALDALKDGKKVSRIGWNGKDMFVVLQKGYPEGIPCNKQTADAWGMNEGDMFKCDPYLQIQLPNGSHSMYVPSINDCLAIDWQVLDDHDIPTAEDGKIEIEIKEENLDFGETISALIAGNKMARTGWNGKDIFVYYVPAGNYASYTAIGNELADDNGLVHYRPYFAIKNSDSTVSTWVPSVGDCLANDWHVVK